MSHITGELVHKLWLRTPKSTWESFYYALKHYPVEETEPDMEEEFHGKLLKLTDELMLKEEPFPESERELYALLNDWVH